MGHETKLGLNIIDILTNQIQRQVTLRKKLYVSKNNGIKCIYETTKYGSNIKYDYCKSCEEVYSNKKMTTLKIIKLLKV